MLSILVLYYGLKLFLLFSIVKAMVQHPSLQRHFFFLAALYTAFVAMLSYVFVVGPQPGSNITAWQYWLGITFLLATLYFWLLKRFDEGFFFWVLLLLGFGLVAY